MRNLKRIKAVILTIVLTAASASGAVFADVDYSEWDSQTGYPPDVVNTQLYAPVKTMIDKKIMTGYPDGTFKPDNPITRAEIAAALTRMTNRTDELDAAVNDNKFSDLAGHDWAKGYINVMADAGIVKGITASTFEPGKNISYAELITMLIRTKSGAASEIEAYGTWPSNYIQYAQIYNLLGDVTVADWTAPAPRGDVAKLIYRFLPKDSTTTSQAIRN
jgi:hypothetical protein